MQAELTKYGEHYKSKHSGRILDWIHSLGTAILRARFKAGTKELSVSLYQAVVLLLFNETTEIPFVDIKEQTNIGEISLCLFYFIHLPILWLDDAELRRVLQSLACAKKKVLKKVPAGKDVHDGDIFKFNADFDDPRPKVHINSIQVKASVFLSFLYPPFLDHMAMDYMLYMLIPIFFFTARRIEADKSIDRGR